MSDTVYCEEVIITTITRRGKGIIGSPIRVICQVYHKSGHLIAENDPNGQFTQEDLLSFAAFFLKQESQMASVEALEIWLKQKPTHANP